MASKPVPVRDYVKVFKKAGWSPVRSRGSHEVFECPTGKHKFVIPTGHKQVSPGVADKGYKAMKGCEC